MEALLAQRPTRAEVDLGKLEQNFRVLRAHVTEGVKVLAVVKADAYGHGALRVSRTLAAAGADAFGVAIVEEGVDLRAGGIEQPILLLSGLFPGQEELVVQHRLTPTIYRLETLESLSAAAGQLGEVVPYHLKIDTGMGRVGVEPEQAVSLLKQASSLEGVRLEGVLTHLSSADEVDDAYTRLQLSRFETALADIEDSGFSIEIKHAANSAGTLYHSDSWFDMVRPGLALYGVSPSEEKLDFPLEPILSLRTSITFLKRVPPERPLGYTRTFVTREESVIATIPVGYGDGLSRQLSNKGRVIIRGHYAPMVGNISMDSTLVDVSGVPDVGLGDEVTIVGSHGDLSITLEDIAKVTDTIAYEVTCLIGTRIPRVYLGNL